VARAEIAHGSIGQLIYLAGFGVTLDLLIELRGVELLEPIPELRKLVGRQLSNRFFKVFDGHERNIAKELGSVEIEATSE
jgi:hypothetical protein